MKVFYTISIHIIRIGIIWKVLVLDFADKPRRYNTSDDVFNYNWAKV